MFTRRGILTIIILSMTLLANNVYSESSEYDKYIYPIIRPIKLIVSLIFSISLGLGILGFVLLIAKGLINWTTGGAIGRVTALRTFESAAEVLAIIPIIFVVIEILKTYNIAEVNEIAKIMESMVNESFQLIIRILEREI